MHPIHLAISLGASDCGKYLACRRDGPIGVFANGQTLYFLLTQMKGLLFILCLILCDAREREVDHYVNGCSERVPAPAKSPDAIYMGSRGPYVPGIAGQCNYDARIPVYKKSAAERRCLFYAEHGLTDAPSWNGKESSVRFTSDYDQEELSETIQALGDRVVNSRLCNDTQREYEEALSSSLRAYEEEIALWKKEAAATRVVERCEEEKRVIQEWNANQRWFFQDEKPVPRKRCPCLFPARTVCEEAACLRIGRKCDCGDLWTNCGPKYVPRPGCDYNEIVIKV